MTMPTDPVQLLSPKLLAQLERLELVTRKVFRGRMKGERRSKRKGQSVEFADFRNYGKDSTKLANFLLDKVRVVTVPGVEFGLDGYLRVSFCGGVKGIREGIERMKWALDPNSPNELFIGERKLIRDWA